MQIILTSFVFYTLVSIITSYYFAWKRRDAPANEVADADPDQTEFDQQNDKFQLELAATEAANEMILEENEDLRDTVQKTAKKVRGIKERHRRRIAGLHNVLDRKNEEIEALTQRLSENYEAVEKIYMEKAEYSHAELKTLISCVLPEDWTTIEYHDQIEEMTKDYRLKNLRRMKEAHQTVRKWHPRTSTPRLNIDNVD